MIIETTNCRVCGSTDLKTVVDLGKLYPSGFLKPDEKLSEDDKVPLVACRCEDCKLVQLKYTVELDEMYRQYWYSSSLNKSMVSSLHEIVEEVEGRINLTDEDYIVDIGANDGTMLQMYNHGIKIGFDPALNLHKPNCHTFINDYFTAEAYWKVTDKKAKVVTAIAMYYDLPDPVGFTKDVASILEEDGLFVVQFTDLLAMFTLTAYDSFCTEHLEYYTLQNVVDIFEKAGLRVIDVSYNDVNGGSVRVTAVHNDNIHMASKRVTISLVEEFNYFSTHDFDFFNKNIDETKMKVSGFLAWAKKTGNVVHMLGASTKGNTLIQHCEINPDLVPFAGEVNPEKFGLRTAGSNIEIISEDESLIKHPDYLLCPIWHFKNSILNNPKIKDYLNSGGHLVFPLPKFTVVSKDGEFFI
jgi:hypothetical protein